MNWLGDYPEDHTTVVCMFTTHDDTGAPIAPNSAFEAADVLIFKNGSATEKTTTNGVTMTSPFNSITGLHAVAIDTSNDTGDGGFWVTGAVYTLVLSADETVDGVAVAKVIGQFGIELHGALRPTTLGRRLDVSTGGEAGIDWANVGSPTTAVNLSATNIDTDQVVASVTGAVGSVTGAVGSVTGAVGSVAAGGITASSFAANAITAAKLDPDVTTELQAGLATATGLSDVESKIDTIDNNVDSLTTLVIDIPTNAELAAAVANVSVDEIQATALADLFNTDSGTTYASAVAGSVVKEIADNAGGSSLTAADIADAVWDEDATGHQTQGTFGQAIGDPAADANTIYGAVVTGAAGATVAADIIAIKAETAAILDDTDDIGVAGAGLTAINLPDQTMNITGNITGNLSGSVGSVTGAVGSVTGAVGSVTGLTNATIADAVWDEVAGGHQTQGTFGQTLGDSVADTASVHAYAAASYAHIDTTVVPTVGAILADTNELQGDWVNGGRLDNILDARASQTSVDDLPTNSELNTALGTADDAVLSAIAALNDITAAEVADAVWLETLADHSGSAGSTAAALNAAGSAGDPWNTALPGAYGAGSAGNILGNNLNATVSSRATQTSVDDLPTNAELNTALGTADDAVLAAVADVDTVVDAIKLKTDSLTFTVAGQVDANIQYVNDTQVNGDGAGTPWGP
jgi:hypothetical protein